MKKKKKVNWSKIPQDWVDKTIDKILLKNFPKFQNFLENQTIYIKTRLDMKTFLVLITIAIVGFITGLNIQKKWEKIKNN